MALDDTQDALALVQEAMLEGDRKYGKRAWIDRPKVADPTERVWDHLEAVKRHADRHFIGETIDADSGFAALAHVAARAMLALQTAINEGLIPGPDGTKRRAGRS